MIKKCKICKIDKNLNEFPGAGKKDKSKKRARCKECSNKIDWEKSKESFFWIKINCSDINCNRIIKKPKTRSTNKCRFCVNKKRPFEYLYNNLIRLNPTADIKYDDFVEFTKIKNCTYCDEVIDWNKSQYSNSGSRCYNLDRKDPNGSYKVSNCVVCCWECNQFKSNKFSFEEFLNIGQVIKQIKKQRKSNGN